jgi:hypothetical protein
MSRLLVYQILSAILAPLLACQLERGIYDYESGTAQSISAGSSASSNLLINHTPTCHSIPPQTD